MNNSEQGIFVKENTHLNSKCVIFGILMATFYWFLSCNPNVFVLPVIFTASYVAMGWYDEMFNCSKRLLSGSNSWGMAILDSIFKPQREHGDEYIESKNVLAQNQEKIYKRYTYLFHALVVAPLLIYIGWDKGKGFSKHLFSPLLGLGLLGASYHSLRLFKPRPQQAKTFIYPVHLFLIMPILLYVGWYGVNSEAIAFNSLLGLGVIAEIYHGSKYLNIF
jgi:hypothetical protein